MWRLEVRWLERACFASSVLPPDIHAEHKYHSLTVMCHLNADGWGTGPQLHTHAQCYKTHRDNLKANLLGSWLTISLTHTHTHAHACIYKHASRHRQSYTQKPGAQVSDQHSANEDISYSWQPLMALWSLCRSLALLRGYEMRGRDRKDWPTKTERHTDTVRQKKTVFKPLLRYIQSCLWFKGAVTTVFR